jgi:protein-S-isoprenylcysteine O-methyltransferase Ste14
MGIAFAVFAVGLFIGLALVELRRYRAALRDTEEFEYPKRRLIRRLVIGALVLGVVLALVLIPDGMTARNELIWYGVCFVAMLAVIRLTARDLHETSVSVVATHEKFKKRSEAELGDALATMVKKRGKKKKR